MSCRALFRTIVFVSICSDVVPYAQMVHMASTAMRAANVRMMPFALQLMDLALAQLVGGQNTVN